jgi:hypothetical protein
VRFLGKGRKHRTGDPAAFDELRLALGHLEARHARSPQCTGLRDAEFRCFSQWGEDGILQYLVSRVVIPETSFVEFGVGDYSESNTRFLLQNDNWRGLVLDGGTAHVEFVERSGLLWRHDLTAATAFITSENINGLLRQHGFSGDIGLLSIDIDGNDYWVLQAIEAVKPRLLVVEYNSTFGSKLAVTVPYDAGFARSRAHPSHLYFGASLRAICDAAGSKGFAFVGSNSAGNDAFFVRRDVFGDLRSLSVEEGYVASRFRESRDAEGNLAPIGDHRKRLEAIADCRLLDLRTNEVRTVRELYLDPGATGLER